MSNRCSLSPMRKSDAHGLILSFWAEWEQRLCNGDIRVVFRKSVAIIETPSFLYAYLNKPIQKIVGRAQIERIARHNLEECLTFGELSGYSTEDIKAYCGYRSLIVFTLGSFQVASKPLALKDLKDKYNFVPSPQAILLSEDGKNEVDARLGFN